MELPEILHRTATVDVRRSPIDAKRRTVELAFSSETDTVQRAFGIEILDHSPNAIRLGRLRDGGPVLVDHAPTDHVGVVESVSVDSGRARATVRISRSARGDEILADIADGIRRHVSVGYRVHDMQREDTRDGVDRYRVTDWEPVEISFVSIPADTTVGVGRNLETLNMEQTTTRVDHDAERARVRSEELDRVKAIRSMGEGFAYSEAAERAIADGTSLERFRAQLIAHLDATRPPSIQSPAIISSRYDRGPQHGYSYSDAVGLLAGDRGVDRGRIEEFSAEYTRQTGRRSATGIYVPFDLSPLSRDLDLAATTALKPTQHLAGNYIDVLRPRSLVMMLGPTRISGLTGAASIPRKTGAGSAGWFTLDGVSTITESASTHDAITLGMKTVAGYVEITHAARKSSSPDLEQITRADLAEVIGIALDVAAIQGSGTGGQPTGITATSGINTDTFTLATPTWAKVINLQALCAADNVDTSSLAYITTPAIAHTLMATEKAASTGQFIWEPGTDNAGRVGGKRAFFSANCPASKIICGNFADLIVADWGALELAVDAGGANFQKGTIAVRAILDVDIAVRHPESFAVSTGS